MQLAGDSQLSDQVRRHVEERIGAGDLLLLVEVPFADGMPVGLALRADHVLVSVTLEVDHVVVFLQLVQLDIHKHPHPMRDSSRHV